MSRIRLHREHGLNPTMPVCFWCGEDKGEVALLGSSYKGEAPMKMVLDYVPCEACEQQMSLGITCMEADEPHKTGHPPFSKGSSISPTGRWVVVNRDAFGDFPVEDALKAQVMDRGKCFLDTETFSSVFQQTISETAGEPA
ncbi:hypothetical protein JYP52_21465 [Nitratireductor aquibiodomus]|uniref:hypothetical protein n=1 Tax=Nitratireductor TaxID=245876 RepID=UPI0013AFCC55|nr:MULTISPECIES: hypothetical protein [Nitratireductor]MBN7763711.1 hypothetical protein [Nitratireductor aquibiodomus]